jgi:hypothetical protein
MPRNPDKTHCQVPGCRSWAMRGHTRCRAHRDAELGPRGAGAPHGNLNALKHGRHAHPLPPPDLEHLARHLVEQPADLPFQIGLAVQSLQARTADPLMALVALRRLLSQLIPIVATRLFAAELQALLRDLPPAWHARLRALIHQSVPRDSPEGKLLLLRNLKKQLLEQDN